MADQVVGAKRAESQGRPADPWHEVDRWIFRMLGLFPLDRDEPREIKFREVTIPDTGGGKVQISVLYPLGPNPKAQRVFQFRITDPDKAVFDLTVRARDLREVWSTVELIARGAVRSIKQTWEPSTDRLPARVATLPAAASTSRIAADATDTHRRNAAGGAA